MAENDPLILKRNAGDTGFEEVSGASNVRDALGATAGVFPRNVVAASAISDISGLGTGVGTALAVNVGTAGALVVNGGAIGTPSSGTVTNLTGTASININGTVGATTPTTGAFTTISCSSVTTSGAVNIFSGNVRLNGSGNGILTLSNSSANDWNRITFGGTTSSFPALKKSGTTLISRLADDSANAPFEASTFRTSAYTVATLPAGTTGATAYVTDATAPTYLGALTGGGSVVCPVFYNGSAWVSH